MTKKTLLGLWLAAAFAFVLAVALLPGWEYVGEGSARQPDPRLGPDHTHPDGLRHSLVVRQE
jgi:hypothetical protein